jgi:sortase A
VVTLVIVALILAAPVVTFEAANAFARSAMADAVAEDCATPLADRADLEAGACVGVLRIPALGADWAVPIRAGGDPKAAGATWAADTTAPGQVGNFVLSGRRLGGGQPFRDVVDLDPGDEVIVETATSYYVYVVDVAPRDLTVDAKDSWIMDPVPGTIDLAPQKAVITLVMRQDLFPTRDRSVGLGVLSETRAK